MIRGFELHPEARAEVFADVDWYDEREVELGERFGAAVRVAIDAAVESPEAWAVWPGWEREPLVRSKGLDDFPIESSTSSTTSSWWSLLLLMRSADPATGVRECPRLDHSA